jgi:K+-sensing histidine kinase KdpD
VKIRRIIVGLQPAARSRAVLEAAADLAESMEAELIGLFVENADLLHFAGFPFAREVGFTSALGRPLDVEAMERSLRAWAEEAHRTLASVAGRTSVRWSFRVTRGSLTAEMLAAAEAADLVIANLESPGELPPSLRVRVVRADDPEALRAALEEADGGILLLAAGGETRVRDALLELTRREET